MVRRKYYIANCLNTNNREGGRGMGNSISGVSPRLINSINTNAIWVDMLADCNVRTLDFTEKNVQGRSYGGQRFEPEMIPSIPKGLRIIFLFPSLASNDAERIMYSESYKTLEALNRELNRRMDRNPSRIQVAVCWTDYVYKVSGVNGNLYLSWARELSIEKMGDPEIDKVGYDLPLLVHTNRHFEQCAFYPLIGGTSSFEVLFIRPEDVVFSMPSGFTLYPCDTMRPPSPKPSIQKLSEYDVRVRRERVMLPESERIQRQSEERRVRFVDVSDDVDDYDDGEYDSGHGDGYDFYNGRTDGNAAKSYAARGAVMVDESIANDNVPIDVLEFFGVIDSPDEPIQLEAHVKGDIRHGQLNAAASMTREMVSTDSEAPVYGDSDADVLPVSLYSRPDTARRRNQVPRSMLPISEHRTRIARVRHSPRTVACLSSPLSSPDRSSESLSSSPLPSASAHHHRRPEQVSTLPLSEIK